MNLESFSLRNVVEKAAVQVERFSCRTDDISIDRRNLHVVEPPKYQIDLLDVFVAEELRQVIEVVAEPIRCHESLTSKPAKRVVPAPIDR
jgi:hypothetical protein